MSTIDNNHVNNKLPATNGQASNTGDSQFLHTLLAQANGEPASGPPALSATPTMSGLLQALRRRWLIGVTLAVLASAAAYAAVLQVFPPKYMASIRMRVAAKHMGPEDVEFPIYKANMEWLVKSPLVLNRALNSKLADGREVKDLEIVREKGAGPVEWLEKVLKTDYLLGPEILRVTLPADHPEEAAVLLNAIADAFLKECTDVEASKKQQRLDDLQKILNQQEGDRRSLQGLLKTQMEVLKLKDGDAIRLELERLSHERSTVTNARFTVEHEIATSEGEAHTLKTSLNNIDKLQAPQDFLATHLFQDPTIATMAKEIAILELTIADYYAKYQEPHASKYARAKKFEKYKVEHAKQKREEELIPAIELAYRIKKREEFEEQLGKISGKLSGLLKRQVSLSQDLKALDNKMADVNNNKPAQIQALEIKIKITVDDAQETARKMREAKVEPLNTRVTPLERAHQPTQKDAGRATRFGAAGCVGVFGLVLFGVAFLEFRTRKVRGVEDVKEGLGIKVIGTIPALSRVHTPALLEGDGQDQLSQNVLTESVDAIRTVLLHHARSEPLRIIMVSSAESGEGKTTLATQLAASLSRAWKRTLLIDADLRYPAAHKLFDVPSEPGLAEVLRGEVEVADAVRATAFSRLWVLPAGNGDSHAIQALAQDNVEAILTALKQQYDFIIVDSPPLLPVTDSLMLAHHVDGVLLAVLSDVSRAPAVYAAQQKLQPLDVHTLGAVVLGTHPEYSKKNYRYVMNTRK